MCRIFFASIVCCAFSVFGQEFWTQMQFRANSVTLQDICFINAERGWAVGAPHWDNQSRAYQSTLLSTTDGGRSWAIVPTGTLVGLNSVHFISAGTGWAAGEKGTVIMTDNGIHWRAVILYPSCSLVDIFFTDSRNGYVAGNLSNGRAAIWKTADGGNSWQQLSAPDDMETVTSVEFISERSGWIAGSRKRSGSIEGVVYGTSDGGVSWSLRLSTEKDMLVTAVDFLDANYGWAVGYNRNGASGNTIFHTINGGTTWTPQNAAEHFTAVSFTDRSRGVAVGSTANNPAVLRTVDGGQNWERIQFLHTGEQMRAVAAFPNSFITAGERSAVFIDKHPWGTLQQATESIVPIQALSRYSFNSIYFINQAQGWVAGTKSTFDHGNQIIFYTADSGWTWQEVFQRDTFCVGPALFSRVRDITIFDNGRGLAVGDIRSHYCDGASSTILSTRQWGQSWHPQRHPGVEIYALHAVNSSTIWLLPEMSGTGTVQLMKSTDGGETFSFVSSGIQGGRMTQGDIFFHDAQHGWVVGGNGFIIATSNGGATWRQLHIEGAGRCGTVWFSSPSNGWVGGQFLHETKDGGITWRKREIGFTSGDITRIQFTSPTDGWLTGALGQIMRTTDGGSSWSGERGPRPNYQNLRGLHFPQKGRGWACGDNGTILRISTSDSNPVIVRRRGLNPHLNMQAKPGDGFVAVDFQIKSGKRFELELLDLKGRSLQRRVSNYQPGTHTEKIDTKGISTGVYFLKGSSEQTSVVVPFTIF